MRGKKIDTTFVAEFISSCVKEGKTSSEAIVASAKEKIEDIDKKIKGVEDLKKIRSKLCDILISFNEERDRSADRIILDFYTIENKLISIAIIEAMEQNNKELSYDFRKLAEFGKPDDVVFIIKQMSKLKILRQLAELLVPGDNYWSYQKFLEDVFNGANNQL